MELTVLIDVQVAKYGVFHLHLVCVLLDNSGMDLPVLFVQVGKHGTLTLKAVNVQFLQHGMELHV